MASEATVYYRLRRCLGENTAIETAYKVLKMNGHWTMGFAIDKPSLEQLQQEVVELFNAHKGGKFDTDLGHVLNEPVWQLGDGGYITTRSVGMGNASVDWHVLQEFGVIRYFNPITPRVTYRPPHPDDRALTEMVRGAEAFCRQVARG